MVSVACRELVVARAVGAASRPERAKLPLVAVASTMGAVLVTVWACVHVVAEEVAVGAAHVWIGGGATGPGGTCRDGGSDGIYRGGGNGGVVSTIGATAAVGGAGDVVVSVVVAAASAVCHVAGAMVPAAATVCTAVSVEIAVLPVAV